MDTKYKLGDKAYIVANNAFIEEVIIVKVGGGFYTLRFTQRSGGTRVRENRLFPTEEAAKASINRIKPDNSGYHY